MKKIIIIINYSTKYCISGQIFGPASTTLKNVQTLSFIYLTYSIVRYL